MLLVEPKTNFVDDRGLIKDILVKEPVDAITVIESKAGVVRGNHYHKETVQWVYLHSGKIKSLTQNKGEKVLATILNPGHLLRTDVNESHALEALEDSIFYVLTCGPRSGRDYESDTFRLETPLKES